MLLPNFNFIEPDNLDEVCKQASQYGKDGLIIAGGTDVMVNLKRKILATPKQVISLGRIGSLKKIKKEPMQIIVGSCVSVAELIESIEVASHFNALRLAALNLASSLIRNRATIGGNIVSARPAADLPAALIAYGARVVLQSTVNQRTVPLQDIFKGPGLTTITKDEVLTHIVLDIPSPLAGSDYASIGIRKSQDCNIVNVCSYITVDNSGCIDSAHIVLGSVGPTHLRARKAEDFCVGKKGNDEVFRKAGALAAEDCKPIDDFRASAEYKNDMIKILTYRTLTNVYDVICKR